MKVKNVQLLVTFLSMFSFSAVAMPFKTIERESFNGEWPFNTDEVQLQCLDGNPYVMNFDDNKLYALTGLARIKGKTFGALPLDNNNPFWLDNDAAPGLKKSLGDVTKAAFDLCDK
ncbi:TPA: DUF2511 domain-containing protein [Escherichia coli]|uniref:DUF2511 domain-containing protein n=1 Tax=Escherichia coli TaxID=562 RepID=UPI00177864DD|nr:DUF2511 domain-containing protein [Escherichia coli]ELV7639702.1 DUF2511 domain-containing protein [Escherichia coli]MBE1649475.1 DUF2511 domain-containing protein [Escherichia coli]MBW0824060.1 YebY family protein [Escherichia coli]HAG9756408.1 DUF2511 domain-containing protein [Escherichia coli]HAI5693026.1 DUF2511 domain-containing protein [Escherichia coli]